MKNFTLITTTLLLLFLPNIIAQKVAPLQLGNIWVYDVGYMAMRKITVTDTNTVIDSISYFKLWYEANYGGIEGDRHARLKEDGFYALRSRDSTYPTPNHEILYYKNNAVIGDSWTVLIYVYSIEDTFTANVFGEATTVKYLKIDSGMELYHQYWTEKFGLLSISDFYGLVSSLLGCVIDGVVYGDTSFTLVGVEDELGPANNFILEQNYPNPFNPTTAIRFTIPELRFMTLVVYDILGNEIATLVNEEKPAGSYEIELNAAALPSGTYFYRFTAGNFSETKKMTVLK